MSSSQTSVQPIAAHDHGQRSGLSVQIGAIESTQPIIQSAITEIRRQSHATTPTHTAISGAFLALHASNKLDFLIDSL